MNPAEPSPVCYRHPDRETFVRCTRCDRPICPDDMREAAVGFQCPDCVREGQRTQRRARTTFGGAVSGRPAFVTRGILVASVAVFALQVASGEPAFGGGVGRDSLAGRFGMSPVDIASGEYYRLLTPMFLHASVLHIAFNMLALVAFGTVVEQLIGPARFAALYAVAGLAGNVCSYALAPVGTLSVGASTSLFGLFGAYAVLARRMQADTSQVIGLIAVNLVITFTIPGIDWRGHIGGLVGGAAVAAVLAYAPSGRRRDLLQWGGTAAVALIAVVVAVVRTEQLTEGGMPIRYPVDSSSPVWTTPVEGITAVSLTGSGLDQRR